MLDLLQDQEKEEIQHSNLVTKKGKIYIGKLLIKLTNISELCIRIES